MQKYKLLLSLAIILTALILTPVYSHAEMNDMNDCEDGTGLIQDNSILELTKKGEYYHLAVDKYPPFKFSAVELWPTESSECKKKADGWNCAFIKIEGDATQLIVDFIKARDKCLSAWAEVQITGAEEETPKDKIPEPDPQLVGEMTDQTSPSPNNEYEFNMPHNPFHALDAMNEMMKPSAGGGSCSLTANSPRDFSILLFLGIAVGILIYLRRRTQ